jgi:hypothetical protein
MLERMVSCQFSSQSPVSARNGGTAIMKPPWAVRWAAALQWRRQIYETCCDASGYQCTPDRVLKHECRPIFGLTLKKGRP